MTDEELKHEAIQYAVDYPTSYGKGYKHKDLRIAYLAGAEPREKRIAELKAQIEKMKLCQNYKFADNDFMEEPCRNCSRCLGEDIKREGDSDKWEVKEND